MLARFRTDVTSMEARLAQLQEDSDTESSPKRDPNPTRD